MKLILLSIAFCVAICATNATKLVASSSRALNRRETNLVKRLVKRQAFNDPNCDSSRCPQINCGKDTIAGVLPNECCQRCIPWEYAQAIGLYPRAPQPSQNPRAPPQQVQDNYNSYQYNQPQQRVDVYIYGPDDGAYVTAGESIYFDCEVISPYNQYAQPRWSRAGNQPLPYKSQSTVLAGNRKLARLTIPDATPSDAGRYECSAGTGNPSDQASIDLQVTGSGYYPRPRPPQPQDPYNQPGYYPQQPAQPQYPPYDPYNQPGQYPPQPQPQPQPANPVPAEPASDNGDEGEDGDAEDEQDQDEPAAEVTTPKPADPPAPAPAAPGETADDGEEDAEYPEDYTENEK